MGIVDEDIVRVREAADIVAIISEHVGLKKSGRNFQGLCPFHAEKTPSFNVSPERGRYHCFGCDVGGDAITFLREIEHLDFVAAVEKLASRTGIKLRYTTENEGQGRARRSLLIKAVAEAVDYYHQRLLSAPDAAAARSYLRSRGLDGDIVREYQIGWAPEGWDVFTKASKAGDDVLLEAGLSVKSSRGTLIDFFRGRVVFPIFDPQGEPLGFGGRILPGSDDNRKYVNSSQTKIYDKSKVLYGLNWAKTDAVQADEIVICEGYTDVIGFGVAGVKRAVATCGTALTEDHIRLLKRFAPKLVLAFDADNAGQAAADRVYEWEKAHEVDIAVADLPDGVDPGELAQRSPDRLREAVERAKPFLKFRVERALSAGDVSTAEGRARTAEHALDVVREHPSDLVRDQYVMDIAQHCRIDVEQLRNRLRTNRPIVQAEPKRRSIDRETPELEALRLAIHRPVDIGRYLEAALFEDDLHASAYAALAPGGSLHEAIERADPGVAELLSRLAVEDTEAEPLDVAVRLAHEAGRRMLDRLRVSGSDADLRLAVQLAPLIDRTVDHSAPDVMAVEELVAFVAERGQPT